MRMKNSFLLFMLIFNACYCGAQTVLIESFENWLPPGWSVTPAENGWTQSAEGCEGTFGPGAAYDGKFAASIDLSLTALNEGYDLVSQEFDISDLKNPEVSFAYFYKRTSTADPFKIEVLAGYRRNGSVEFESLAYIEPENGMSEWKTFSRVINRNAIQIKIRASRSVGATFRPLYIDNFCLSEGPSVAAPVELKYSYHTGEDGKLSISWKAINDENKWNLKLSDKEINPETDKADIEAVIDNTPSYTATGLVPGTTYYVYVQTVSGTETSEWADMSFKLDYAPVEIPLAIDFEDNDGHFMYAQENQPNAWAWGEAAGGDGKSMYISKDGGATNEYIQETSMSYIYKNIVFPEKMDNGALLTFDFRGVGSSPNHVTEVWLIDDLDIYPEAGVFMKTSLGSVSKIGTYICGMEEWGKVKIEIPASYAGKTERLVIGWRNNNYEAISNPPAAIDNISITASEFLTPQDFAIENVTENSVTLNWTETGTATEWEIEYRKYGQPEEESTIIKAGQAPPFTVTGLDDCTQYVFKVRSCSGDSHGDYSEEATVSTKSKAKTAPYTYNFDDINEDMFPTGWSYISNRNDKPYILSDHPVYYHSSPNCVGLINVDGQNQMMLISPPFSDLGDKDKRITFYANISMMQSLTVGVMSDPEDPNTFVAIEKLAGADYGEMIYRHIIYLNSEAITAEHKYIAFKIGTVFQKPAFIDDFVYEQIPELIEPDGLHVLDIDATNVRLTWTAQGKENKWETIIGDDKFIPEDDVVCKQTDMPMAVYEDLTPNTAYRAYVRAVNENGEKSPWSESYYFRTSDDSDNVLPFMENFDSQLIYGMVPPEWRVVDYNTLWELAQDSDANSAPNCLVYDTAGEKAIDDWLFTPKFMLDKDHQYMFVCRVKTDAESNCSLSLHYGESPAAESMGEAIYPAETIPTEYKLMKVRFVPRETGYYHIGINTKGILNSKMWLDDALLQDDGTSGINGVENAESISVYPHMVKDVFYVELPETLTDARITVYNMAGVKVKDETLTNAVTRISADNLTSGTYIVKINAGNVSSTHKITISK